MSVEEDDSPDDIVLPSDTTDSDDDEVTSDNNDDTESPQKKLADIYDEAQKKLKDADRAGDETGICLDCVSKMVRVSVSDADADDSTSHAIIDTYLGELSQGRPVTKTALKKHREEERAHLMAQKSLEEGETIDFKKHLETNLQKIKQIRWTDKSGPDESSYILNVQNANNITVSRGILYDERKLWQAFCAKQNGDYPERACYKEGSPEWDDFINELMEKRGKVEESEGPRHGALRALKNRVREATPYGTPHDAIEMSGVYLPCEPPNHDEIHIPREIVSRVLTTTHTDVTYRKLQLELTARNMAGGSMSGDAVANSTTLDGNYQTFWVVDADGFDIDVDAYREEAEDIDDRMGAKPGDTDTDTDNNDVVNTDDNKNEYGKMGSSGGDDDE